MFERAMIYKVFFLIIVFLQKNAHYFSFAFFKICETITLLYLIKIMFTFSFLQQSKY